MAGGWVVVRGLGVGADQRRREAGREPPLQDVRLACGAVQRDEVVAELLLVGRRVQLGKDVVPVLPKTPAGLKGEEGSFVVDIGAGATC